MQAVASRSLSSGGGGGTGDKPTARRWSAWDKPPSTWEAPAKPQHGKAGQLSRDYRPPVHRDLVPPPGSADRNDRYGQSTHAVLDANVNPVNWRRAEHADITPPSSPPSPPGHIDERTRVHLRPIEGERTEFGAHRPVIDDDSHPPACTSAVRRTGCTLSPRTASSTRRERTAEAARVVTAPRLVRACRCGRADRCAPAGRCGRVLLRDASGAARGHRRAATAIGEARTYGSARLRHPRAPRRAPRPRRCLSRTWARPSAPCITVTIQGIST